MSYTYQAGLSYFPIKVEDILKIDRSRHCRRNQCAIFLIEKKFWELEIKMTWESALFRTLKKQLPKMMRSRLYWPLSGLELWETTWGRLTSWGCVNCIGSTNMRASLEKHVPRNYWCVWNPRKCVYEDSEDLWWI